MKKYPRFYVLLVLLLIKLPPLQAQDSVKFNNKTAYLSELITHTSPNNGAKLHLLSWLTNTSNLAFQNGHSLSMTLMLTHGGEPSANIVGDLQTFSNIEAGFLYGFYEVFYQYEHKDFWLKIGQQDINSDLLLTQTGLFYTHSSFGADPVTTINIPAPTYPVAALAITTHFKVNNLLSMQLGVFDGQFAQPKNDFLSLDWSLSKDEGLLYVVEPAFSFLKGKWVQKIGFYHHSGLFQRKDNGNMSRGLSAFYLLADIQLKEWTNRRLDLFYQYSRSSKFVSDVNSYFGIGLKMTNPLGSQPEDEFGIALGYASLNTQFLSVIDAYNVHAEAAIEVSYKTKINDWLSLQPYVHYLGMDDLGQTERNPLIFALRAHVSFENWPFSKK